MSEKPTYEELEQRVRELESVESRYKRTLEEQQQKKKRYQNLFENMLHEVHVWQLVYDDDGNIITWKLVDANPAALKSWDKNLSEIVGRPVDEIFPNSNATELFMPIVKKIFAEDAPHIWESYFPATDQFLHMISVPFGEYFISTGFDITDRKKAEEALQKERRFLDRLMETSPVAIIVVNREGQLAMANAMAEKALGLKRSDMYNRTYDDPDWRITDYHGNHLPEEKLPFQIVKRTESALDNVEHAIEWPDGRRIFLSINAAPLFDGNGDFDGMVSAIDSVTDRKKAEDKLLKSEAHLEEAQRIAHVGSWDWIAATDTPSWSRELCRILEVDPDKPVPSMADQDRLYTPDSMVRMRASAEKAMQTGEPYEIELERVRDDGSRRWLLARGERWYDEQGKIIGLRGTALDITDRKQAEIALKASEVWLKETTSAARVGGWKIDLLGNTLEWTDETYRIHELPTGDPPTVAEAIRFYHAEDRPRVSAAVQYALENGEDFDFEARIITAKQNLIWVRSVGYVGFHEETIVSIWGTIQDITEKKQVEEALRESEERMKLALDSVSDAVWDWRVDTGEVYFSSRWYTMLGYEPYELPQDFETWRSLLHPDDLPGSEAKVFGHLESAAPFEIEFRIRTKDNNWRWILARGKTVEKNEEGKAVRMLGTHVDITERKILEERIQQTQKMESIGNLAGGIAHDFNNILFPIVGMSELLLEDLPEGTPEYENVEEILRAGKRGSDLVKQILAFSRQSEQKMMPIRIQKILKEVIKLTRATIPTYIEIHQDIQPDCGKVMADATQIHQVAMNLITNAFHAVEAEGGRITVRLKEISIPEKTQQTKLLGTGKYALLSITDTGHGMSSDVMPRIFDPYFTTKEKGKGTGLGLAAVYGIIKEHGGEINVKSKVGRGATFDVYLPLIDAPVDAEVFGHIEASPTGTERILVVDDEEPIARLEKQMLQRLGYAVTMRLSSIDALEAFRSNPHSFDLVISDMSMPNMTGVQLANELFSIRQNIPVIICTGFSERINGETAASYGIKGFLMKPIIRSELAKIVRKVLDEAKG